MARRPTQEEIPGTEQKRIAGVEHAADSLEEVRTRRIELNAEEAKAEQALAKQMTKHELSVYHRKGFGTVTVEEKVTKLKVKVKRDAPEDPPPTEEE